jgi:hypothetical protein
MKKSILLVLIFALITGISFAQRPSQVTIANNTGYTIYYLYISTESDSWGESVSGSQVLRSGSTMIVNLPSSLSLTDRYNIMAVGIDGDSYIKWNTLMPEGSRIEFTMADFNTDTELSAVPTQSMPQVTIVNNTGYTIYYLYISQTGSDSWGDDAFGSHILNSGSAMAINLPFPVISTDQYNIMAVGADGDAYIKWNALVTENGRIEFTMADFNTDTELNVYPPQNMPQITIVNYTGYTFHYLYIKPAVSDSWGGDLLGERTLNSGYQINVNMPYPASVSNQYYIRAVDSAGDSYTKWNIIVSEGGKIYFVVADVD